MTTSLIRLLFAGDRAREHHATYVLAPGGVAEAWASVRARLGTGMLLDVKPAVVAADPDTIAVVWRQACFAGAIGHQSIARVRSFGAVDGCRWLRLQPLFGRTLEARLDDAPLAPEAMRALIQRLGLAVETAKGHGFRHGPLTPDQVFLIDDDPGQPVILGFGLGRLVAAPRSRGIVGECLAVDRVGTVRSSWTTMQAP